MFARRPHHTKRLWTVTTEEEYQSDDQSKYRSFDKYPALLDGRHTGRKEENFERTLSHQGLRLT